MRLSAPRSSEDCERGDCLPAAVPLMNANLERSGIEHHSQRHPVESKDEPIMKLFYSSDCLKIADAVGDRMPFSYSSQIHKVTLWPVKGV